MVDVSETLLRLLQIEGCVGACVVDGASGRSLGATGRTAFDLEVVAAGNSALLRAPRGTPAAGSGDVMEEVLITTSSTYHLIRPLPSGTTLIAYLVLDRTRANLAVSRYQLRLIDQERER